MEYTLLTTVSNIAPSKTVVRIERDVSQLFTSRDQSTVVSITINANAPVDEYGPIIDNGTASIKFCAPNGEVLRTFVQEYEGRAPAFKDPNMCAITHNGDTVFLGLERNNIFACTMSTGQLMRIPLPSGDVLRSMHILGDGKRMLISTHDGVVSMHNIADLLNGKFVKLVEANRLGAVFDAVASGNGEYVYVLSYDCIRILDSASMIQLRRIPMVSRSFGSNSPKLFVTNDGKNILCAKSHSITVMDKMGQVINVIVKRGRGDFIVPTIRMLGPHSMIMFTESGYIHEYDVVDGRSWESDMTTGIVGKLCTVLNQA